jgi:branched-subunit amino acid transport protein
MNKYLYMALMALTMALVTYLVRMIPMVFFRRKITSRYINSLLYYIPYAVLSAMTFPFIFYSTGNYISASVGTAVALFAAYKKRSLVTVAILACTAVLCAEGILLLF